MTSRLAIRLDQRTMERVKLIARRKRISVSEAIRRAVKEFVNREEPICNPYEAMKDLIGVVRGGDTRRSEHVGRKFTAHLKARRTR